MGAVRTETEGFPDPQLSFVGFGTKALQFSWTGVPGAFYYRLLEDPDGVSGFAPLGADVAADITTVIVPVVVYRQNWLQARYRVAACNNVGCTDSNDVDIARGLIQELVYTKAFNTSLNGRFGSVVALSNDGTTLAVGAIGEASSATGIDSVLSNNAMPNSGSVYIFSNSGGAWAQTTYVKASNTGTNDQFGSSIALSADGTTLVVGAPGEAGNGVSGNQSDDSMGSAGAVYVFTNSGGTWTQQAYVKASNPDAGDAFGTSVALSADGTTLVVGAPGEASNGASGNQSDNSMVSAGAVYVFTNSGGPWTQLAYVKASNPDAGDTFGRSVALSGDGVTLAVGAPGEASNATGIDGDQNDNSVGSAGAVYVLTDSGGPWTQQAYVKASNPDAGDAFGRSVALSGDGVTLAVGAPGEASNATGINGLQTDNSAEISGAVYVFESGGGSWAQQAYVKASNAGVGDVFGLSVTLSGDGATLAIGAYGEASNSTIINGDQSDNSMASAGAVYVLTRSGGDWTQLAYMKPPNPGLGFAFGWSVALSADSSCLAIGSIGEASNATGIGGGNLTKYNVPNAGAAYLY